jgi:hypothetical protein
MPNGASVYVGRGVNSVFTGRAVPTVNGGVAGSAFGYASRDFAPWPWPRLAGACKPIVQCCCAGPVNIAPGEVQPIIMNWGAWIESLQGLEYRLDSILALSLLDPAENMQAADAGIIKIISGRDGDPDPPDNTEAAQLASLAPPYGVQVLIEVAPDARIGAQYKLDICVGAHDCDGRKIRQCSCVVITIAEC